MCTPYWIVIASMARSLRWHASGGRRSRQSAAHRQGFSARQRFAHAVTSRRSHATRSGASLGRRRHVGPAAASYSPRALDPWVNRPGWRCPPCD